MRRLVRVMLPAPIVLAPEIPEIVIALGALIGLLGFLFHPIVNFVANALKWVSDRIWQGINATLGFASTINDLAHGAWGLAVDAWNHVGALEHSMANLGGAVAGAVANAFPFSQVVGVVDGAEHYVIGVAEDLYNRAIGAVDGGVHYAVGVAEDLYNRAVDVATGGTHYAVGVAEDLYNQAVAHADGAEAYVIGVAEGLYNQAHAYTDAAVGTLEQVVAQDRVNARTVAEAAAGAATGALAQAISTTYDPCCNFLSNEVSPWWSRLKGLLGKMTRRGPLLFLVLGAMAEAVDALDAKELVGQIVAARQADAGSSVAALRTWGRLKAA